MRPAIFLSASVPISDGTRGTYWKTADAFLIRSAVRELLYFSYRQYTVVWGGHPAITPMVAAICDDIGGAAHDAVALYQSAFFKGRFPKENERFRNLVTTPAVGNDLQASLALMRTEMLSVKELVAAVFVSGMEGIEDEFELFCSMHPGRPAIPVASTGGAALRLAQQMGFGEERDEIDYADLFAQTIPSP